MTPGPSRPSWRLTADTATILAVAGLVLAYAQLQGQSYRVFVLLGVAVGCLWLAAGRSARAPGTRALRVLFFACAVALFAGSAVIQFRGTVPPSAADQPTAPAPSPVSPPSPDSPEGDSGARSPTAPPTPAPGTPGASVSSAPAPREDTDAGPREPRPSPWSRVISETHDSGQGHRVHAFEAVTVETRGVHTGFGQFRLTWPTRYRGDVTCDLDLSVGESIGLSAEFVDYRVRLATAAPGEGGAGDVTLVVDRLTPTVRYDAPVTMLDGTEGICESF